MKVEAYKCDYCKNIFDVEQITGVKNETDMFESSNSYPTITPSKTQAHFCLECYRVNVDMNVKNKMNWRDGERYDEAREKLKFSLHKEYFFIFKKEVVRRNLAEIGLRKKIE